MTDENRIAELEAENAELREWNTNLQRMVEQMGYDHEYTRGQLQVARANTVAMCQRALRELSGCCLAAADVLHVAVERASKP